MKDSPSECLNEALTAFSRGDEDAMKEVLERSKSDPSKGGLLINEALQEGHTELARSLHKAGVELDVLAAAGLGEIDTLADFFDNSNNLRISDDKLIEFGTMEMTKFLAKPLTVACKNGQMEAAFFLIKKGADINLFILDEDDVEASGLHWAARYGHYELVKFLINYGARIYSKDTRDSLTPAEWAEREGHEQISQYIKFLEQR